MCCAYGVIYFVWSLFMFQVCAFKPEVHNHMLAFSLSLEKVFLACFAHAKCVFCIVLWCKTPVLSSQAMNPSVCEYSNHNREFDSSLDVTFVCQHVLLSLSITCSDSLYHRT